jgi:predicted transglutaminase-like cysteine proteinase
MRNLQIVAWYFIMTIRMALAALVILVGLQTPSDHRPSDPFAADTIAVYEGPLVTIWNNLREQLDRDDLAIASCAEKDTNDCTTASRLMHVVDEARQYQGKAVFGHVNRSINLVIKPALGSWAGALETLKLGSGDCKGYSIAKYVALLKAGVSPTRIRLLIVHDRLHHEDHMLLGAFDDGHWFLLDNRTMVLLEDTDRDAYAPMFVLDDTGVRRYVTPVPGS